MIEDREIIGSLQQLREDIARLSAMVLDNEARAQRLPHRTRYLMLQQDLARRLLQAHSDWLDTVERELGPQASRRQAGG